MTVSTERRGDITVAALSGEVDLNRAPEVRRCLIEAVKDTGRVVVDLHAVDYIDSSGVAALVEAYQAARKRQGSFLLANVSPAALRVFKLARLDKVFPIHESLDEALDEA